MRRDKPLSPATGAGRPPVPGGASPSGSTSSPSCMFSRLFCHGLSLQLGLHVAQGVHYARSLHLRAQGTPGPDQVLIVRVRPWRAPQLPEDLTRPLGQLLVGNQGQVSHREPQAALARRSNSSVSASCNAASSVRPTASCGARSSASRTRRHSARNAGSSSCLIDSARPTGAPLAAWPAARSPVRCDTRITSIFRQLRCLCLHDQARRNARTP